MAPHAGRRLAGHRTVVLTGPESTGKSTLAARLARRFGAPLSLEFARQYVDRRPRHAGPLGHADVDPIARGQMALEDAAHAIAIRDGARLLVKDTDLISTVVYARHYHERCPDWIVTEARARRAQLYLLLAPDTPWVADGEQRGHPAGREDLHRRFAGALAEFGAETVLVSGDWAAREAAAEAAVIAVLAG